MRKFCEIVKKKDVGAIGIGAMIVFIAMVLVAGIAASVLIQTSTRLESQAMTSGQETIAEVSTGIAVFDISGYAATSGNLDQMAIDVRARAGSQDIDLDEVFVELSDTNLKIILHYNDGTANNWNDSTIGVDNIFGVTCFPASASDYGIMVLEDFDASCTEANPVINRGDKVYICINTTATHSDIAERVEVFGHVVPELGSPGVIKFRSPASYAVDVFDLQ